MTKLERRYKRKEFVDNGYDIFTEFMFEVCNKAGISLYVTDNASDDTIVLTAWGDWKEVQDEG